MRTGIFIAMDGVGIHKGWLRLQSSVGRRREAARAHAGTRSLSIFIEKPFASPVYFEGLAL